MQDFINAYPGVVWVLCGGLLSLLTYFLKADRRAIKKSLDEKASKEALDMLREENKKQIEAWRSDLRDERARSKEAFDRLETQYEQKLTGIVNDLHSRIETLDAHLRDKLDLMLNLLERRKP